MTLEEQLIKKAYYETFMEGNDKDHPVRVLGEAYLLEQSKELADVSFIRFAQGEVYFHNKDFEAAIFKWENIQNELQPWAQKNMADAYYELGLLSTAEGIYNSIISEDMTLTTEIALQLLSLYIEQGKLELAVKVIKNAVSLNPDYPNITEIARTFYEEYKDWSNAVELSVNQAIRTETPHWFDVLKIYVDKGCTKTNAPEYFSKALIVLHRIDRRRFEKLSASLWSSYKNQDCYFSWLKEFNSLFLNLEAGRTESWHLLSAVYEETYFELINGRYLIKEIVDIIPNLLANWLKIADSAHSLFASAAVLSWDEIFPSTISAQTAVDAEQLIFDSGNYPAGFADALNLFESIRQWTGQNEAEVGRRLEWLVRELTDLQAHHLLLAGTDGSGKAAFINTVLEQDILEDSASTVVMLKPHDHIEIHEIADRKITAISNLTDFREAAARRRKSNGGTFIELQLPSGFLIDNTLTLIDTPCADGNSQELFKYLHFADCLLFVLNAAEPFTDKQRNVLMGIQEHAPDMPILFLLNKIAEIEDEQEAKSMVEDTCSKITAYVPNAKFFAFSPHNNSSRQRDSLAEFLSPALRSRQREQERTAKILYFIRTTITSLLEKRVDMENSLVESIRWNEEMAAKLTGAIHQLSDVEAEKTRVIKKSYRTITEKIKKELMDTIPVILRKSSDFITEDSDFGKLHLELNDEMNNRIRNYLQDTILPDFLSSLQEWISFSSQEFNQSQFNLDEMSESFNTLYMEERLKLECDFKVLDDWRRDADRMTNGVQMDKVNILLRRTPSQVILKSAGKLFGAISQNKTLLFNKYKQFIENEDYQEIAELITNKFLQQFELFEKSIGRDITMFFRNPFRVLNETVEQTYVEIETSKNALSKMRTNPEVYRDPLTLFEVRLRQYEWATAAGKEVHPVF